MIQRYLIAAALFASCGTLAAAQDITVGSTSAESDTFQRSISQSMTPEQERQFQNDYQYLSPSEQQAVDKIRALSRSDPAQARLLLDNLQYGGATEVHNRNMAATAAEASAREAANEGAGDWKSSKNFPFAMVVSGLALFLSGLFLIDRRNGPRADRGDVIAASEVSDNLNSILSKRQAQFDEELEVDDKLVTSPVRAIQRGDTLHCTFSGWATIKENQLSQEWHYYGQGLDHRLIAIITIERSAVASIIPGMTHTFVDFLLSPANGYEGSVQLRFCDTILGIDFAWPSGRMSTMSNDFTSIKLGSADAAEQVLLMLMGGNDLRIGASMDGEALFDLPMPNRIGLKDGLVRMNSIFK